MNIKSHLTVFLLVIAISLTGKENLLGQQDRAADAASDTSNANVISYNIRYLNNRDGDDVWPNRKSAVAEVLKDADVFGLQEAVFGQIADLQSSLSGFDWYAVGREDGVEKGEATPIAWRTSRFHAVAKGTFWLSETPTVVGSKGWDAALPRIASWVRLLDKKNKSVILVINTHFDHRGAQARAESAALLREWIATQAPTGCVALMGDFNALKEQEPIQNILESKGQRKSVLVDAREAALKSDPGPDTTWNGFRQLEPGRRIDFIFTRDVKVKEFETLNPKTEQDRFASDHLPIRAHIDY